MGGALPAELAAAEASLTQAETNLELKLQPFTESEILSQRQAVQQAEANLQKMLNPSTSEELDAQSQSVRSARAALALKQNPYQPSDILSAEAGVEQALASMADAQANLDGAVITAPFDGVIGAINLAVGEMAFGDSGGTSSNVTLVSPDRVRVDVQVDETDIARLSVGQAAQVTFDALGQRRFRGTVAAIAPTGSATQGVVGYQVRIELGNAQGVRPGMTATVEVVTQQSEDVLMIPNRAIARSSGGAARATAGSAPASGARQGGRTPSAASSETEQAGRPAQVNVVTPDGVQARTIRVGLANDQNTEVVAGLEEGDEVVLPTTTARASVPGASSSRSPFGISGSPGRF
jgi:HlyD family secretion protein